MVKPNKWHSIHDKSNPPLFAGYFKTNLINFLEQAHDPLGEKNQPKVIINDSKNTLSKLTRLFDAYKFPVPTFEQLKEINKSPHGLRDYMQDNLKELLPALLNQEKNALHPDIIKAIGQTDYDLIKANANGNESAIAIEILKGVFAGFGQRVMDNTTDPALKLELFGGITRTLTNLGDFVTLNGLPPPKKAVDYFKMSNTLLDLLDEAKKRQISIPGIETIEAKLILVNEISTPGHEDYESLPEETKKGMAESNYDQAIEVFKQNLKTTVETNVFKPPEVSWWKQALRAIFRNETLLLSDDEKRYAVYQELRQLDTELNKPSPIIATTPTNDNTVGLAEENKVDVEAQQRNELAP